MTYFLITNAVFFEVTGIDSERYLNARLTNDVRKLEVGRGCFAAALSPQGKTQGVFDVFRISNHGFVLASDARVEGVDEALRKYIVTDHVSIAETKDFSLLHTTFALNRYPSCPCVRSEEMGADFLIRQTEVGGIIALLAAAGAVRIHEDRHDLLRARVGIPHFPEEICRDALFVEAGLRDAISEAKGCYVGQEVVEKVRAVGRLPRIIRSAAVEGCHAIPRGTKVFDELASASPVGETLSSIVDKERDLTYVFLRIRNKETDIRHCYLDGRKLSLMRSKIPSLSSTSGSSLPSAPSTPL